MFSGQRAIVLMKLQYLRNIVNVIPWRVRIETWRQVILSFIDLRHKLFQRIIDLIGRLLIESRLLKPSYSLLFLILKEVPFLLTFFVDVATEVVDLRLKIVEFIVEFLILGSIIFYGFSEFFRLSDLELVRRLSLVCLMLFLIAELLGLPFLLLVDLVEISDELRLAAVTIALIFAWRIGLLGNMVRSEVLCAVVGIVLIGIADVFVDLVPFFRV